MTSRIRLLLCLALLGSATIDGHAQPPGGAVPREVNITSDSAPGWLPSVEQEQQARETLDRYFAALDSGEGRRAYDMMAEGFRANVTVSQFARENGAFRLRAGPLRNRRILKITWTKDPADAPSPGVYAAIDVAAQFANIDRQCGYVVVFQRSPDSAFDIVRMESNFIDNESARQIEREHSRAELDRIWAGLASNCPNFAAEASR